MHARMKQPAFLLPDAMKALMALSKSAHVEGVPETLHELLHLRVSQINGCGVCLEMHARAAAKAGESAERLATVAGWRDTPYFTDAERAALALAEAVTRVADRADPVPDEVWNEAARHYDEKALAGLLISIGAINIWNRLNAATRQVAGSLGV
ncbi:carboxymuconolactone decarboxylase family protein [Caulobacter sp. RL271]|jgi:AhpD family alkylhydroperoxidase|uniref:Carboxymuconolactone decarboxylase family protein n=1 Tax=Caulobacter segnis TaxID=88688 RepID=A0ABY4ZW29_9CAUL|nr:carboxymuconolactone decarboxylase family protein [Caulobacter segnis]USQ97027.1 carboxymuconolactone decarboxylase family protein [Caulobacter segnis]